MVERLSYRLLAVIGLLSFAWASPGVAAAEPAQEVVRIWPGQAPGTESWTGPETTIELGAPGERKTIRVSNVTVPSLTVFKPSAGKANGTSMIVLPGGGFQRLAMEHEGYDVAKWLAEQGVTAFVLKYRVRPIPGFGINVDLSKNPGRFAEFARTFEVGRGPAIADAIQAMRYVRSHATSYAIATDRVGMIGFSAGAITTLGVILNGTPADRPNFAAPIYGAMIETKAPPADAPPIFLAVAQDDPSVPAVQSLLTYNRWTEAGLPAELHVYERGGHGFGMRKLDAPVDHWTEAFAAWLASHGWVARPKPVKH
jgi:acetyl esterase/lipase